MPVIVKIQVSSTAPEFYQWYGHQQGTVPVIVSIGMAHSRQQQKQCNELAKKSMTIEDHSTIHSTVNMG
jgi:hypothetical protein